MTPKLRIATIMARHGTTKYQSAVADLRALFERRLPQIEHTFIVVDNALPVSHEERLDGGMTLIGGSNAAWEFSAWDSAIAYLGSRLDDFDFVHLATSAFRQLYVDYLDRFSERMLNLMLGRSVALGHVDYYNESVSLLGVGSQSWLRTSFVFLPPAEIRLLKSLVSVTSKETFFSGDPAEPFLKEAPISPGYRKNILGWLTGDGTEQGVEWHSRFKLDPTTLPFFESKVLAILNEQMLTNRLRAQGCAVVDATWAATVAEALEWRGEPFSIPCWQQQLVARDSVAAPASILA
ncbi:hypothetical protein PMI12_05500 [Variovorax sp. CF313]|uniref:hypothetical protein n=1 Tax=Variovorax sp. CF313 TaxID=1144315 RepID=UPI0002712FD1|nr:hypothetical protein [Variovorax sp. CF313]EJL67880.1 hypothetical protein PMI12_05500 [Variovorax sp. CF313]